MSGHRTANNPVLKAQIAPYVLQLSIARVKAGLSQLDVANHIGVHQTAVSAWECGLAHPGFGYMVLWAECVGLSVKLERAG